MKTIITYEDWTDYPKITIHEKVYENKNPYEAHEYFVNESFGKLYKTISITVAAD